MVELSILKVETIVCMHLKYTMHRFIHFNDYNRDKFLVYHTQTQMKTFKVSNLHFEVMQRDIVCHTNERRQTYQKGRDDDDEEGEEKSAWFTGAIILIHFLSNDH